MKKFLLIAAVCVFTSLTAKAEFVGFRGGNDFVSRRIVGQASISCANGGFQIFTCEQEILDPGEYAYFKGHQGVDAEKVILNAIHEDGSTREKNEDFDPATGLSKDSFNLWIQTLFQRPLLDMGKNKIEYTLSKDGQSVMQGSFEATVTRSETRYCEGRGHYYSSNPSDCQFPAPVFCGQYFREFNYCE